MIILGMNLDIDDEVVEKTIKELEKSIPKELYDPDCAKTILGQIRDISPVEECECRKKAVVKALLTSTWTQRLYFDVRSVIMSWISAILLLGAIWFLGSINVLQGFIIGVFVFVSSLFISRLFDRPISSVTRRILRLLSRHKAILDLILKNF
jgi:hypothetical protein